MSETQDPWIKAGVEHSRKTPCPHCGKTFLRKGNLVNHMEKQTCLKGSAVAADEKPFSHGGNGHGGNGYGGNGHGRDGRGGDGHG